jgi:type VI secretion system protein ImpK
MTESDPFAGPGDFAKTVIKPRPDGRAAAPPSGPGAVRETTVVGAITSTGINPLVGAAAPLLAVASRLRNSPAQRDVEGLRQRVIAGLEAFKARAQQAGTGPDQLRAAHYALCATIDDLVLNTPWGSESLWSTQSMVSTFHTDVAGGERFYDLLGHLHKDPGRNGDVLELMYLCLSLGFEGRMRVPPNGGTELARVRDGIYRTIRQLRGEFERELSPHWAGVTAAHRPLASHVPLWVVGLVTAVLLLATYMGFSYTLNRQSDGVYQALARLPPLKLPVIETGTSSGPPPVLSKPVAPPPGSPLARFRAFLAPEIAERRVEVTQSGAAITIRVLGSEMFGSGSATIQERSMPLLKRIGLALRDEPGAVTIVGHTDNVGIRTVRFPSNWHLSKARALAVLDMVAPLMGGSERLTAVGRGDSEPIASNETAEGRVRNRRIEFILDQKGAPPS